MLANDNAAGFTEIMIKRQVNALACERFIITATKPKYDAYGQQIMTSLKDKDGTPRIGLDGQPLLKPVMIPKNLCRPSGKGTEQTPWTLPDLLSPENLNKIKYLNANGFAIFITPQEQNTDKIFILVDDIENQLIENFGNPNSLCQTSPNSRQAVYTVPYVHDRGLYMNIFFYLNLMHGDKNITGFRHPFRLTGFSNQKPKYQDANGNFPFVKLLSARKTTSPEMLAFIDQCASGQFPLEDGIVHLRAEYKITKEEPTNDTPTNTTAITPALAPRPHPGSTGVDHRGSDYSAALRAAWSGLEGEELENFVSQNSMHVVDPCGYDMNTEDFIRKTAENAVAAVAEAKANFTPRPVQKNTGHRHMGATNFMQKRAQFLSKKHRPTAEADVIEKHSPEEGEDGEVSVPKCPPPLMPHM